MTGDQAVVELLRLLGQLDIPHMLVGSYSSNFYGIPRSTKDADLVVLVEGEQLKALQERLPSGLVMEEQALFEMVTATRKELLKVEGSSFQIELFHLSEDEFDQLRFQNRVAVDYGDGVTTFLPRAEDVIVQKLRWAAGAQRKKDFDDVVSILKVHEPINFDYIEFWCERHGSLEQFSQARAVVEV